MRIVSKSRSLELVNRYVLADRDTSRDWCGLDRNGGVETDHFFR